MPVRDAPRDVLRGAGFSGRGRWLSPRGPRVSPTRGGAGRVSSPWLQCSCGARRSGNRARWSPSPEAAAERGGRGGGNGSGARGPRSFPPRPEGSGSGKARAPPRGALERRVKGGRGSAQRDRFHRDLNSDRWIQSPECSPLHHGTAGDATGCLSEVCGGPSSDRRSRPRLLPGSARLGGPSSAPPPARGRPGPRSAAALSASVSGTEIGSLGGRGGGKAGGISERDGLWGPPPSAPALPGLPVSRQKKSVPFLCFAVVFFPLPREPRCSSNRTWGVLGFQHLPFHSGSYFLPVFLAVFPHQLSQLSFLQLSQSPFLPPWPLLRFLLFAPPSPNHPGPGQRRNGLPGLRGR